MHICVSLHNWAYKTDPQLPNRKDRSYDANRVEWVAEFRRRISKDPDGCWRIRGRAANKAGHVHILLPNGWRIYAHRIAWWLANGKIPTGMSVLHRCDNPRCVNPAHLFLGTTKDNMHDAIQKGRKNCFGRQRLNADQVREIRALAARGDMTHKAIGERYGLKRNSVWNIVNRKCWKHV
jgi:hypothetical protein